MANDLQIPEKIATALPPLLRAKIETHLNEISRQGSVLMRQDRGRISWRLRYRVKDAQGGRRHASIGLGRDEGLVEVVETLLTQLRAQREARDLLHRAAVDQEAARVNAIAEKERRLHLKIRTGIRQMTGGGRRHKAAVLRQYDKVLASGSIRERSSFVFGIAANPPKPPKRGRPRTSGTCLW